MNILNLNYSRNFTIGVVMGYDFKFSVIMPIYNVEKYLSEAIDSIINQSIGFEENMELVIVDDGSPDNSKDIALKYQEKYPNNIKVLSKLNGGQASAFNLGLKHVNGKYISFVDSDDHISLNAFEEVYNFFEEHHDEVDLVSIPIFYFERRSGQHILNYKFHSARVIDLVEEPNNPQLHIASSFIKKEALEDLEFNTIINQGYDALMVNKILLNKKKLGVVNSAFYNYRKRFDNSSIMDCSKCKKEYFTHSLKNFDFNLIKHCLEREGDVPKFIQYEIAYNLQWYKGVSDFPDYFTEDEIDEFWETFHEILTYIDEDVIKDSKIIRKGYARSFLMYLKNGKEFHIDATEDESKVFLKTNNYILNNLHNHRFYIDLLEIEDGFLRFSGTFSSLCDFNSLNIEIVKTLADGTEEIYEGSNLLSSGNLMIKKFLGIDWIFKNYFDLRVPISDGEESKIDFYMVYNEDTKKVTMKNKIKFRLTCPLSDGVHHMVKGSQILSFDDDSFYIFPYSNEKFHELKREMALCHQGLSLRNEELNKRNKSLIRKNEKLKEELKEAENRNNEILNSNSWKLTEPFRKLKRMF